MTESQLQSDCILFPPFPFHICFILQLDEIFNAHPCTQEIATSRSFGSIFANIFGLVDNEQCLGVMVSVEKLVEVAKPLQKNQMYNWFDRYKSKEQQKVYILNSKPDETTGLSLSLVKRLTERKT